MIHTLQNIFCNLPYDKAGVNMITKIFQVCMLFRDAIEPCIEYNVAYLLLRMS